MEFRNRILTALPAAEIELLVPRLERVSLPIGRVIYDPDERIESVIFPEDCIVSQLSIMSDGSGIETATVGHEGMVGLPLFHGVDRVLEQAFVQVSGSGHQLDADAFRELLPRCPTLSAMLHRYAQAQFTLVAQSSGCNRKHAVDQRCARWLLLVHDGIGRDRFDLTQLFLSQMLGVRRATVTGAAGELQRRGAIRYTRGRITIVDREKLEEAACECYAVIRCGFERLIEGRDCPAPFIAHVSGEERMTTAGDGTPSPRLERATQSQ
jgi:CRP-like cAMP-binding protein